MATVPKSNILVVDDEEITRQLLSDFLSEIGYRVQIVSSGEEGLQAARENAFDLIITDIRMAGMSGIQLMHSIREINIDTAFLVITGYSSLDTAIAAMNEGAYAYITKPFIIDELRIIVERAIERQNLLREAKQKDYYRDLSILDGLTQIYNHRYFHELLERELSRVKRYPGEFSLMMADIDNFKSFNDSYGHLTGDMVLKAMTQMMVKSFRRVDSVCRYGGEEFTILLPQTTKEVAQEAACRFLQLVNDTHLKDEKGQDLGKVTLSVGIASYPADGQSKENLIKSADLALYQAKREGKNKVCVFTPNLAQALPQP